MARVPTRIGDVAIPAGTTLMAVNGAATRDPRPLQDPATSDADRPTARQHLAFGFGIHTCPGAPLARAEGCVSIERLVDRLGDIRISEAAHGPPGARRYEDIPTYILRGLQRLHVEFTPLGDGWSASAARRKRASHYLRSVLPFGAPGRSEGPHPMPLFPKPAEGSWTEHYPDLGTGPVSYEDSISPELYERERDAIFARTWLNVGRVEQLPKVGSYFTREIDAARSSIVVVHSSKDEIRAFHNIGRHRGNKLVWTDYPAEETSGTFRQFTCKYHGWRYNLEGECTFVQQETEFFDLDKGDYPLASVQADEWEGFIFVNLDPAN